MRKPMARESQSIPDEVLDTMMSAMLDPALGREASIPGNVVRKQVLIRSLNAAAEVGWTMQKTSPSPKKARAQR